MTFTTILCREQLNREKEVHMKLQAWENSGLQLVLLPADEDACEEFLNHMDTETSENALWIVAESWEWKLGTRYGIALLAYDPDLERTGACKFPLAETIVLGFDDMEPEYLERMYRRGHGLPWVIAANEEFVLREFVMSDLDGLFELYEDDTLYPFVEPLFSYEKEAEYEEKYICNMYHLMGYGMWLVCDAKSGRIIGRAGVENHDLGEETGLEMGYLIHRDYRGKGLAERVLRCVLDYVKQEFEFTRIDCMIHEDNEPSIRLAEKLGFVCMEKTKQFLPSDPAERRLLRYQKELTERL